MDIFSHGLWAGAGAKAINVKVKSGKGKILNVYWAVFWGMFPDLFAFTIPFLWLAGNFALGHISLSVWKEPVSMDPYRPYGFFTSRSVWPLQLASRLYNFSHSAIIFGVVFAAVYLTFRYWWRRRIPWEMGGWLLHILMDVPTHTYRFFPTPVLWPLFGWKWNGTSWATPGFLIIDYSLLIIVYGILWFLNRRKTIL